MFAKILSAFLLTPHTLQFIWNDIGFVLFFLLHYLFNFFGRMICLNVHMNERSRFLFGHISIQFSHVKHCISKITRIASHENFIVKMGNVYQNSWTVSSEFRFEVYPNDIIKWSPWRKIKTNSDSILIIMSIVMWICICGGYMKYSKLSLIQFFSVFVSHKNQSLYTSIARNKKFFW